MSEQPALLGVLDDVRRFLFGLKEELPDVFAAPTPTPERDDAATATLGGLELPLRERREPGTRTRVEEDADGLIVVRGGDGMRRKDALREFYAARAAKIFRERVAFWAERMGLIERVMRVTIKDQRSLWGSCSEIGNLNFNWRVVLAPPEVLDYLVIHELAHLREMNHSPRFWAHVGEHCADYKARRKWLRQNAARLKNI